MPGITGVRTKFKGTVKQVACFSEKEFLEKHRDK